MQRLKIIEHISLDGVIQAQGPKENTGSTTDGHRRMPVLKSEAIMEAHGNTFDRLLSPLKATRSY